MTRAFIPQPVLDAAHARAAARAGRDWATADRLRAEIETAGWRVVDSGTDFRLELAHAPDLEVGGRRLYGSSSAVPSRLGEPATGPATVIIIAGTDGHHLERAVASVRTHLQAAVGLVIVADDPGPEVGRVLDASDEAADILRTSEALGAGAAWNMGIRRASGEIVMLLDSSVELGGDIVEPLAAALADPRVAVAGPVGVRSADLRRFEAWTAGGPVTAIDGLLLAFRRADALTRGPVDEGFRSSRHLDTWWSLTLRDGGPEEPPRDAIVVGGLPLIRHAPVGSTELPASEPDRLSRRNHYRLLDRFRGRDDLLVGEVSA
ncbi:MAG: glycosyltransferase family 2 protein [Chloroflexi bacterium]|nr:glycosyltransferase family 2 protein [Chloroflexota bacterium]